MDFADAIPYIYTEWHSVLFYTKSAFNGKYLFKTLWQSVKTILISHWNAPDIAYFIMFRLDHVKHFLSCSRLSDYVAFI